MSAVHATPEASGAVSGSRISRPEVCHSTLRYPSLGLSHLCVGVHALQVPIRFARRVLELRNLPYGLSDTAPVAEAAG